MDNNFDCQPHTSNKATFSLYTEYLRDEDTLLMRPAYQRSPVWDEDQKANLIDSIMRLCPMPIFLFYAYVKDIAECIDGQNRLTAIKEYIEQTVTELSTPWAWRTGEDRTEYVFYANPATQEAMLKYCESKTKAKAKKQKIYRLMTPMEVKRFNSYQCTISEIHTKLTFDQRKDIFLRWQSGTGISQCDRFKNEDYPFCNFVRDQGLERSLATQISGCLKTGRKNWFYDLYRLVNIFQDGITESSAFISTIKARTKINSQTAESFSTEEMKGAVKRCEKFLSRFPFMNKVKGMYISFLLEFAFLWITSSAPIREVMEKEEFFLKFAKDNLSDDSMTHNTLNNGPNEAAIVAAYPRFKMSFMVAYDEQKPAKLDLNLNPKAKAKVKIPTIRKKEIWNKYIGESVGMTKCVCCGIRDITQAGFVAGHVVSEDDGGTIDVENLRPICLDCNLGMGTKNMVAWMKTMYPGKVLVGTT